MALERRVAEDRPILFGLFGAGFMGRGILNQNRHLKGVRCAAVCNRSVEKAVRIVEDLEIGPTAVASSTKELDLMIDSGWIPVTGDPEVLCGSELLDCVVEATGHIEYGAQVLSVAMAGRKHMVLMNAELDGTVGPLLAKRAADSGLIYTGCDGDQPAVQMDLYRFVLSLGLTPLVCGNVKGLQDRYRNPTTQESFARIWGQTPSMVTSFADGTKISFEQAIVANATGMGVATRGMTGMEHGGHVDDLVEMYDHAELKRLGGVVDYVIGSRPSPGVYVLAEANDRVQAHYLKYGKLGDGPLYSFYVPYHLTVLEVARTVVRVVEHGEAVITPKAGPVVDVITAAKRNLRSGEVIDGLGGYMTYGLCENYEIAAGEGFLPIGLAEGCVLRRDVEKDAFVGLEDVDFPDGALIHQLRTEQDELFAPGLVR